MDLTKFDFELPTEQIAQFPKTDRASSKLLVISKNEPFYVSKFLRIMKYLRPNDVVILNDTKVIPARLMTKKKSGGRVEIFLERIINPTRARVRLGGNIKNLIGKSLIVDEEEKVEVVSEEGGFYLIEALSGSILEILLQFGQVPLPPYIKRKPKKRDEEFYQTIYGTKLGAVAAPTAGLHVTERFFEECKKNRVKIGFLTLHVASGTYQPIKTNNIEDHHMHSEYFDISEKTCKLVRDARQTGGRVVAIGTTVLRALESLYLYNPKLLPFKGETDIYIKPGFDFCVVDTLVTNFHLPKSSLFVLACAFGGIERMKQAYAFALNQDFKFFSYGDAMYIERKRGERV